MEWKYQRGARDCLLKDTGFAQIRKTWFYKKKMTQVCAVWELGYWLLNSFSLVYGNGI